MEVATFIKTISLQLPVFLIVQARVSGLFASLFFFRRGWVPTRILLIFTLVLSFFIMQCGVNMQAVNVNNTLQLLPYLIEQLFIGLITGIIINFFVEIFLMLGQFVSMQAGLGLVNLYVQRLGSITPLTQFFILTATMIFFQLNGHLILIKMMVVSCTVGSLNTAALNSVFLKQLLVFSKIIFNGSVMLSLSVVITLLLCNFTIGMMTKFSPQINIFSVGINISLIVVFFACYLSFDLIVENGNILLNEILGFAKQVMQ